MVLWLALGSEPSEFRCLPEEMLARLDQFPDAVGQVDEIMRHYGRIQRRREDDKLREMEPKAMKERGEVLKEFNRILGERAERRGTTLEEEQKRLHRGD